MTEAFDRDSFAAILGTGFKLEAAENKSVMVQLSEVTDLVAKRGARSFSLIFMVPEGHRVEQGVYNLFHETLGSTQLFLVPIGTAKSQQQLQAVFNFLVDGD